MKYFPAILLMGLGILYVVGAAARTYPLPPEVLCSYKLAEVDAAPADILFIGSSRVGQGIDPGYIQHRLKAHFGKNLTVERLVLNFPNPTQFLPLVHRYIEKRGTPKYVFLQLLYNFKPERHRTWDLPINNARNVAFEKYPRLLQISNEATLNDYDTVLSRKYERGHQSALEILLFKIELNILSAVKLPSVMLKDGLTKCKGEEMYRHQNPHQLYNSISDAVTFSEETPQQTEVRVRNAKIAATFMPLDLRKPTRLYENSQMQDIINILENSGSHVILMTMPALGETSIQDSTLADISMIFPHNDFVHPYTLFETEVGEKLAISYKDTHHVTKFGALQISKYYADYISNLGL